MWTRRKSTEVKKNHSWGIKNKPHQAGEEGTHDRNWGMQEEDRWNPHGHWNEIWNRGSEGSSKKDHQVSVSLAPPKAEIKPAIRAWRLQRSPQKPQRSDGWLPGAPSWIPKFGIKNPGKRTRIDSAQIADRRDLAVDQRTQEQDSDCRRRSQSQKWGTWTKSIINRSPPG